MWQLARAAGYATATWAALLVIGALTDEGNLSWAVRLARAAPLAPVAALLGGAVARDRAAQRGELRAMLTVGTDPLWPHLAWSVGAWLVPAALAVALSLGLSNEGFVPQVATPTSYTFDPARGFTGGGMELSMEGELALRADPFAPGNAATPSSLSAAMALVVLLGAVLAILGATLDRRHIVRRASLALVVALPTILLLQLTRVATLWSWLALAPAAIALVPTFRALQRVRQVT
jgi:hypothetical protein